MSDATELSVTHTSTVNPDQIDHLGHMNVRYYQRNAGAATAALLSRMGIDPASTPPVDMYTRHHREQLEGSRLQVRSGVVSSDPGRGDDRLRLYHELVNPAADSLAATFVHVLDHPAIEAPAVAVPAHGMPRSIDPTTDPLASAPTLDRARELHLANRSPRQVGEDDLQAGPGLRAELGANLVWGGEPVDGSEKELVRTDEQGRQVGYATMETRLIVATIPALGTPIQSFGAVTAITDKVTTWTMWAFDLETGALVVSFEVVSLAFDLAARRAVVLPEHLREEARRRFHPELAPA